MVGHCHSSKHPTDDEGPGQTTAPGRDCDRSAVAAPLLHFIIEFQVVSIGAAARAVPGGFLAE